MSKQPTRTHCKRSRPLPYYHPNCRTPLHWIVLFFRLNGPLRQHFSLYRAVYQRDGERKGKLIDEKNNVQTTPTRTYRKRNRPLFYYYPNQ